MDEIEAAALRTFLGEAVAEGLITFENAVPVLRYGGRAYMLEIRLFDVTGA